MRFAAILGALAALTLPAIAARAQSIDDGRRLYLEADFEGAQRAFEALLARPSLDVPTAAEAHRYLAVLSALSSDPDGARRHAAIAVALDPSITGPEGAPPSLAEAFDEARASFGGRTAELSIAGDDADGAMRIRATLDPAPEGLAAELSLRCVSGSATARETGPPPAIDVSLEPAADSVHCRAAATTPAGAPLFRARSELAVQPDAAHEAALVLDEDEDEGGSAWPFILVGAGVVAAGAIVAVLLLGGSSDSASVNAPRAEW